MVGALDHWRNKTTLEVDYKVSVSSELTLRFAKAETFAPNL
jgi:hypothetical protein